MSGTTTEHSPRFGLVPPELGEEAGLERAEIPSRLPVVAIVGRPNTGKSTLFNRIVREPRSVVASFPGVTRDSIVAPATHRGHRFLLVDTGGFEAEEGADLEGAIRRQSLLAAEEADVVIAVLDGRAGLNPLDIALASRLRELGVPVCFAVNKMDSPRQDQWEAEFFAVGAETLYPISAEHGLGVGDLVEAVLSLTPASESQPTSASESYRGRVAIIGRPNVGKSSLLNCLAGFERAIVSPVPGTTRDPIDTVVEREAGRYLLVDTAGIRRRPRVQEYVERASVVRALRALERAEVALLLVDAAEGMTEQDARIGTYAWDRGRSLILLVNKWDAVPRSERDREKLFARVDERFPSLSLVRKLTISARTGSGTDRIWSVVDRALEAHRLRMQTARLNQVMARATESQPPPIVRGRRPKLLYAAQTATSPPTVTIFGARPASLPPSYARYLENRLRAAFPLESTPVRLRFRAREGQRG